MAFPSMPAAKSPMPALGAPKALEAEAPAGGEEFDVASAEAFDALKAGDLESFQTALKAAVKACYAEEE